MTTVPATVQLLLSHNANPHATDHHGKTALDYAMAKGHKQNIRILTQHTDTTATVEQQGECTHQDIVVGFLSMFDRTLFLPAPKD